MKNLNFELEKDEYFDLRKVMATLKVSTYRELVKKLIELYGNKDKSSEGIKDE